MFYISEVYELKELHLAIDEINQYCKKHDMKIINFEIAHEAFLFRVVANLEYVSVDLSYADL